MNKIIQVSIGTLLLSMVLMPTVYAYIDAGTGSLIFQAIAGAVLGIGFGVRLFWGRIKLFFHSRKHKKNK